MQDRPFKFPQTRVKHLLIFLPSGLPVHCLPKRRRPPEPRETRQPIRLLRPVGGLTPLASNALSRFSNAGWHRGPVGNMGGGGEIEDMEKDGGHNRCT